MLKASLTPISGAGGVEYLAIDFKLGVSFGSTSLKAFVLWNEKVSSNQQYQGGCTDRCSFETQRAPSVSDLPLSSWERCAQISSRLSSCLLRCSLQYLCRVTSKLEIRGESEPCRVSLPGFDHLFGLLVLFGFIPAE